MRGRNCGNKLSKINAMQRVVIYISILFLTLPANQLEAQLTFEEHVRPIFKQQCFHCHGEEEELPGGLDVRLVRLMQAGGDSGSAIVPANPEESLLWQRIESDEMPEGEKKLSPEQKQTVRDWIKQGAKTKRPEPEDVTDARFTERQTFAVSTSDIRNMQFQHGASVASDGIDYVRGSRRN